MSYLGRAPSIGSYSVIDDISSSFNSSANTFTLRIGGDQVVVSSPQQVMMMIGGLGQRSGIDYTVSGANVIFTSAPAANDSFHAVLLGDTLDIGVPSDGTVKKKHLAVDTTGATTVRAGIASRATAPWSIAGTNSATLAVWTNYAVNTSVGSLTLVLPTSPVIGDSIRVLDHSGGASANNITLSRNGNKIQGSSANLVINTARAGIGLVFISSATGWVLEEII